MSHIDPSHFVALSFLILVGFMIWKRFFNVCAVLDEEIDLIKKSINDAAHAREAAYAHLKKVSTELEGVDAKVADVMEKGRVSCDALILSIREEIVAEITQKKILHAQHAKHLEERFHNLYKEQLIADILGKLKTHLKEQANDAFHEQQLEQSLGLLSTLKIAA